MDNANYHAAQTPFKPTYFVEFVSAPPQFSFVLVKTPQFDSKDEAFAFLHHYEDEFGASGHVYSRFGLEPDPRNTPQDKPFNDEDVPQ